LRDKLETHQVLTVVLPASNGEVLKIRKGSTPEPAHKEIYQTLRIPREIMKPVKIWQAGSSPNAIADPREHRGSCPRARSPTSVSRDPGYG
jgi:hypothetical protein